MARHFSLITGWSTSYPEPTGYIAPTMLDGAGRDQPARVISVDFVRLVAHSAHL